MSISYQSKDSAVLGLQLKVQELCVKAGDQVVSASGADLLVAIGEKVLEVRQALEVAANGTVTGIAASAITLVDSSTGALGGDKKTIKIAGLALAAGDSLTVKYVVSEE